MTLSKYIKYVMFTIFYNGKKELGGRKNRTYFWTEEDGKGVYKDRDRRLCNVRSCSHKDRGLWEVYRPLVVIGRNE